MKFRSLALTAMAFGALGISGCGGDDIKTGGGSSSADANTLLINTFQPSGDKPVYCSSCFQQRGGSGGGSGGNRSRY